MSLVSSEGVTRLSSLRPTPTCSLGTTLLQVCKGLPFYLTAKWSERRDMASLREFVKSLDEGQLDVL